MHLVIVESGAKAKTIQKHLESLFPGRSFQVLACFGHIRDLPEKEIGVDTSTWEVKYVDADKKGVIPRLRQAAKDATMVYLASDPDREGEAIAYHLKERLKLKPGSYKRVTFNEITRDAIGRAFASPREIDMPLVDAQETRRILDRIVGYELSPLLWRRYSTSSLSAGRVQSTALQMIVQRAKEADKHSAETFWNMDGKFALRAMGRELVATLYYEGEEARWDQVAEAEKVFDYILQTNQKEDVWTMAVMTRVFKKSPAAPFITTTLQKEAYELHKIPGKQVMSLAQKLYESGYITYMRTDSPAMSELARAEAMAYIRENVRGEDGSTLVRERIYKAKGDHSQEAHECIRPSHMEWTSDQLRCNEELSASHVKIYDLIWRRAVASQMVDAEYNEYEYTIQNTKLNQQRYTFQGTVRVLVKPGFLQVYSPKTKVDAKEVESWNRVAGASQQQGLLQMQELHCKGDATRGQGLYNEPSIVKAMEKAGIGRPSTYASIIEKLFTKKYIIHGTNPQCDIEVRDRIWAAGSGAGTVQIEKRTIHLGGNEKDRFVPTSIGYRVVEYLAEAYPSLLDVTFTSRMEAELDEISNGKRNKEQALGAFYKDFHTSIEKQLQVMKENVATSSRQKGDVAGDGAAAEGGTTATGGGHKMKVLKSWAKMNCDLVETKYGLALYETKKKKFISIKPYLEWKGKESEDMTEEEVRFLKSFPKKVTGSTRTIELGPYGIYVKDGKKNIPLPKEQWSKVQDGIMTAEQINQLSWVKRPHTFGAPLVPE